MKVAILADSNALPRGKGWGDLPWESTYPYLLDQLLRSRLKNTASFVVERGMRYRTIRDVEADWSEIVELRKMDYAIIQVGGADCAPRVLLPKEREWFKRLFWKRLGRAVLRIEDKYRRAILARYPHRVCVREKEFRLTLDRLVERSRRCGLKRLILVNIFDPSPAVLLQFSGAEQKIQRYNAVLADLAASNNISVVNLHALVKDLGGSADLTVDGLHLNPLGQKALAEALGTILLADGQCEPRGECPAYP